MSRRATPLPLFHTGYKDDSLPVKSVFNGRKLQNTEICFFKLGQTDERFHVKYIKIRRTPHMTPDINIQ